MIFGEFESGAYFDDSGIEPRFEPNRIAESGHDFVVFDVPATDYEPSHLQTWRVDGDMIYAEIERWQFREYFRRLDRR